MAAAKKAGLNVAFWFPCQAIKQGPNIESIAASTSGNGIVNGVDDILAEIASDVKE